MYLAATVSMETIRSYEVHEDEFRDAIRRFVSPKYEIKQGPNREVQVYLEPLHWRWGSDCFNIKIPSYVQGGCFVLRLDPPPSHLVGVTAKSNPLTGGHFSEKLSGGIIQEAHEKMMAEKLYADTYLAGLNAGVLVPYLHQSNISLVRKPSSKKKLLLT